MGFFAVAVTVLLSQDPRLLDPHYEHDAPVVVATLAPDGETLIALDEVGTLTGWHRQPRRKLYARQILKKGDTARRLTCSPDGRYLAISSREIPTSTLLVLGLADGKEVRRFERGFSPAFTGDGEFLACCDGSQIRRWAMKSGAELPALDESPLELKWMAWSPTGTRIAASARFRKGVMFWDVPSRRIDPQEVGGSPPIGALAFSPDGKMLAVGHPWSGALIQASSAQSEASEQLLEEYARGTLSFSPDGRRVISSDRQRHVSVWDRSTGQRLFLWHSPVFHEGTVDIDPSGRFLLWIEDRGIRLERIPAPLEGETSGKASVTHVGFTDAGKAVTVSSGGEMRLWEPETEREIRRVQIPDRKILRFAKRFQWVVFESDREALQIWDIASGKEVLRVEALPPAKTVEFSPDHRTMGLGLQDGSLSLWDIASRKERSRIRMDGGFVTALTWSQDGKTLAWGNLSGEVVLAEGELGGERLVYARRGDRVRKLEFFEDGKRLRMFDARGSSWVYTGVLGEEPQASTSRSEDSLELPDSRWLQSAFWTQAYWLQAFSPDGRYAIGTDRRGSAMIWRAPWDR
jgi:WD40 repeat protein